MILGYFRLCDEIGQVDDFMRLHGALMMLRTDDTLLAAFPSEYSMEELDADWEAENSATTATFDAVSSPRGWLRTSKESILAAFEYLERRQEFH